MNRQQKTDKTMNRGLLIWVFMEKDPPDKIDINFYLTFGIPSRPPGAPRGPLPKVKNSGKTKAASAAPV
jgi:hypothetical protein